MWPCHNDTAKTAQAFGEFGYTIETGFAAFEPFVRFAHINVRAFETRDSIAQVQAL